MAEVFTTYSPRIGSPRDFEDTNPPVGGGWAGWLSGLTDNFDKEVVKLKASLDAALAEVMANPSSPTALSAYQSRLQEYNMYRMLQSNTSKNMSDMDKSTIRNLA